MDSSSAGSEPRGIDPPIPTPVDTGERLVPGAHPDSIVEAQHLSRYHLAATLAAGRRVLDAGCGLGYGSTMIARAGAAGVVGLDIDEKTISWAREAYGGEERLSFEVGDLLAMPVPDRYFDLVVCFEAIEHVVDPERALDELRRVMTEDGVLVVSSPNRVRYTQGNRFHFEEMTSDELVGTLSSRFENVRLLRQSMHLASAILDEDAVRAPGPEVERSASLRRLAAGRPGEELFAVALAGNGELPEPPNAVMLTDGLSLRAWHDSAAGWRGRAIVAEARRQEVLNQVQHAFWERDHAVAELEELRLRRRRGLLGRLRRR